MTFEELLDAIGKTTKKVADLLQIREVREVHHSPAYDEPKGQVSQIGTNIEASRDIPTRSLRGWMPTPRTVQEWQYTMKVQNPLDANRPRRVFPQ